METPADAIFLQEKSLPTIVFIVNFDIHTYAQV